jgi:7-carboxy-7-deazaguanine synthase
MQVYRNASTLPEEQVMKVSEIFHSVQGEGPNIGVPSVFLRLAICNLQCSWCDTKYTWDWKQYDYKKEITEMKLEDMMRQLRSYDCGHLVITGGEPMLQQDEIANLVRQLKDEQEFYIEVETNGTIIPNELLKNDINQWNVSPKINNSGNAPDSRERPLCYSFFREMPNAYFKYVVETENDLKEILDLVSRYRLTPERVILMPQAVSVDQLRDKSAWLVERCKKEGFRFSTRLHIVLYGNKRGL